MTTMGVLASPAAAATASNEAEFRAAWTNPAETLITLTANITFACDGDDLPAVRNSSTAIVVDGAGFTLSAPAPCTFVTPVDATLYQQGTGAVTVRNLTFTGSANTGDGLLSGGDVTVEGSTFSGHGDDAIDTSGNATLTSSTLDANDGDGLDFISGIATVTGSTISNNDNAGIDGSGNVSVSSSTISNNDSGGIETAGNVSVTGSTITGNDVFDCVGGISAGGTVAVTNSTISQNEELGIFASGDITVMGSTISGNSSAECFDGEGIFGESNVTVSTSTISENEDDGIFTSGTATVTASTLTLNENAGIDADVATVTNSTVTDNIGFGISGFDTIDATHVTVTGNAINLVNVQLQTIHLFGSVVVDGDTANCLADGPIDDQGFNFVNDATCAPILPNLAAHQLGALGSNGGSTQTRLPADTSPLVDAIPPGSCQLSTDQRGMGRPAGAGCDIGAAEVQPPAATINDVTVIEGNAGSTINAVFTVTLSRSSTEQVTVAWATANQTATAPGDYAAGSGTVTFAPGDTAETITVVVNGDIVDEPNETFAVNLTSPVGAAIGDAQGIGTILDDDGGPVVTPTPTPAALPNTRTPSLDPAPALASLMFLLFLVALGGFATAHRRDRLR